MNTTSGSNSSFAFSNGFWWNGVWHEDKPSHGDDDGPPTGVREPRRPRKPSPAGAAVVERELVSA